VRSAARAAVAFLAIWPRPAQAAEDSFRLSGFLDGGYLDDPNNPSNHEFRSRGTTWHLNEWDVNMAALSVKKAASETSRFGVELTLQAGKDSELFGYSATAPNLDGSQWLRHFGAANVSYLSSWGKGLTLQGGIFSSLIGYDSLYAKDNFSYTRPWGADFTPYLMLGINASYPFSDKLTGTFFVVNGYWHLAHANNVPSFGAQAALKPNASVTLKETLLYGPHQSDTAFEFWRFLSDTSVERKGGHFTVAAEYQCSFEKVDSTQAGQAWWMAGQLPLHWTVHGPFSLTLRPEIAWDSAGRWTLHEQTVKAVTTTLEYKLERGRAGATLRFEYRYDESRGNGGGFFTGVDAQPGVPGLRPSQHLLIFAVILTADSSAHP
jgi:hypothetical protein